MSEALDINPQLRGVELIKRHQQGLPHAGGEFAGQSGYAPGRQNISVDQHSFSVNRPQINTEVIWPGPPRPFAIEIDVFPLDATYIQGNTIPYGFIEGALLMCPLCTWDAPMNGPDSCRGQIYLNAEEIPGARAPTFHMWFDQLNKFHILEPIKCGWIPCPWTAQLRGGVAYPLKGKHTRRYSYIPK